jgi:dTDP-4-dehydrorhamnose 3,5-epimerase
MIKEIEQIDTLTVIAPEIFKDHRGQYIELFNIRQFDSISNSINIPAKQFPLRFVQDDISISKQGVLRGFHGDNNTWKLIGCLFGGIFVAIVNYDKDSVFYLKHYTFTLNQINRKMILVPPKHGLAHMVMSNEAIFWYKQSTYYTGAENQFTIRWNDPKIGIDWPNIVPILSERDANAEFIK